MGCGPSSSDEEDDKPEPLESEIDSFGLVK
jgi:hypothetical protein